MVSKMLSCTLKFISFGNLGVMNIVCVSLTHNILYAIFTFLIVPKKCFCLFVFPYLCFMKRATKISSSSPY